MADVKVARAPKALVLTDNSSSSDGRAVRVLRVGADSVYVSIDTPKRSYMTTLTREQCADLAGYLARVLA